MKITVLTVVCAVVCGASVSASAQDRIYRCGNEYTNHAPTAKQRNCQVVEGGHVTVVHSRTPAAKPAPASANAGDKAASAPTTTQQRAAQINPDQQKARDNDARTILQAELARAQERLQALKLEFNDGNLTKSALEMRNPQAFNERLEALKTGIARQESDVAGIERELARHAGS